MVSNEVGSTDYNKIKDANLFLVRTRRRARAVSQWQSTWLACVMHWVQYPVQGAEEITEERMSRPVSHLLFPQVED